MGDYVRRACVCPAPQPAHVVRRLLKVGITGVVAVVLPGCSELGPESMPTIDSTTVASADVTVRIDPTRTYEYDFNTAPVESLLTTLWNEGVRPDEAWWPLDYRCKDPRGARLTLALERPADERMAAHDFRLGTGRLACSEELRQYVIGIPPGSFYVHGIVQFVPVEGGCWVIQVNEQLRYEPLGLPEAFRSDGREVRALLRLRDDLGSFCMTGRIAELLDVENR